MSPSLQLRPDGMHRAYSGVRERFITTVLGSSGTEALDSEMVAVGYEPIPGIRGRNPDSEVNETARIWAIVESAHSELLDVIRQLFGMGNEYRKLSASWTS
jgi:hypothetical protein